MFISSERRTQAACRDEELALEIFNVALDRLGWVREELNWLDEAIKEIREIASAEPLGVTAISEEVRETECRLSNCRDYLLMVAEWLDSGLCALCEHQQIAIFGYQEDGIIGLCKTCKCDGLFDYEDFDPDSCWAAEEDGQMYALSWAHPETAKVHRPWGSEYGREVF